MHELSDHVTQVDGGFAIYRAAPRGGEEIQTNMD